MALSAMFLGISFLYVKLTWIGHSLVGLYLGVAHHESE